MEVHKVANSFNLDAPFVLLIWQHLHFCRFFSICLRLTFTSKLDMFTKKTTYSNLYL